MDYDLPEWMKPSNRLYPKTRAQLSPEERELEQQTFSIAFESLLERMADAITFGQFCNEYLDPFGRQLSQARFRTWIFAKPERKKAYYGAKVMAAEAIEDDLIRIADGYAPDGTISPADPVRSKLMVDIRWKLLPIYNPDRYAPTTKIETNTTITTKNVDSVPTYELKRLLLAKNPQLAAKYGITMEAEMDGMDPGETPEDPLDPPEDQEDTFVPLDPIDG